MRFLPAYLLLGLAFFTSCEVVDAPYKSKGSFGQKVTDTERTDTVVVPSKQNVLIEDFTGWACGNCPAASEVVAKLIRTYGSQIVSSKIHVTEIFAAPEPPYQLEDFRTPIGDELFAFSKASALPNGMVNRRIVNDKYVVAYPQWEQLAKEEMAKEPAVLIKMHHKTTAGNDGNTQVNTQIQLNYLKDGSLQDKLALYIIEDSVIGTQKDYRTSKVYKENYAHMEVFRGAVTGAWGEDVKNFASDTKDIAPKANQKVLTQYNFDISNKWKSKNVSIIAVLYDDKTKQVIQVARRSLDNIRK
jgi:hypothetical protein